MYLIKIFFSHSSNFFSHYSKNFISLEFETLERKSRFDCVFQIGTRLGSWRYARHNATIRGLFIEERVLVYMPLNGRDQFNPAHSNEINILMDRG